MVIVWPSLMPAKMICGRGSLARHSRSGTKLTGISKPRPAAQSRPSCVFWIQRTPHGSLTLSTRRSSVKSGHSPEAVSPVQVSTLTRFHRSSSLGKGGWSAANNSLRCCGQNSEGSVPETAQITFSVMLAGRGKSVGLPPVICGTANCIKLDQTGAAPVRPVTLTMGV